jgi:hypothetical protein
MVDTNLMIDLKKIIYKKYVKIISQNFEGGPRGRYIALPLINSLIINLASQN